MRELIARRHWFFADATVGILLDAPTSVDERMLAYTEEDTVRPFGAVKVSGETAIPTGRYSLTVDYSKRFRKYMFHIESVPGFDGIRIHAGNTAADTEGCILVGDAKGENSVLYSRASLEKLYTELTMPDGWDESRGCSRLRMKEPTFITVENGVHLEPGEKAAEAVNGRS